MIRKNTLFILGAGASIPYGFPSGAELRDIVCGLVGGGKAMSILINSHIESEATLIDFATAFRHSKQLSIDTFLSKRPDLAEVGKLFIAAELCRRESIQKLLDTQTDDDWYSLLWNALQTDSHDVRSIGANRVRFVTFNYDRSLECALHEAAKNSFNVSHEEAHSALSNLPIIHPYGCLGEYSWASSGKKRGYEPDVSDQSLS